jgi:hypothetical protein
MKHFQRNREDIQSQKIIHIMIFSILFSIILLLSDINLAFGQSTTQPSMLASGSVSDSEIKGSNLEVEKLRAEVRSLEALDPSARWWSTMLGAIGGIVVTAQPQWI